VSFSEAEPSCKNNDGAGKKNKPCQQTCCRAPLLLVVLRRIAVRGVKMSLQQLRDVQKQIAQTGRLPGGTAYRSLANAVFQTADSNGSGVGSTASALTATGVGALPNGYQPGRFDWDRQHGNVLLALFVNAADAFGVSIGGIEAGDTIIVESCSGIASFSEDTGSPLAASIVGVLAAGLDLAATLSGHAELTPVIEAGETFAKDQFKATHAKTKLRDAFGVDPGSGHKAKQEGGVIISFPEAQGPYYSGNDDHKERWIKAPGDRSDTNRPAHVHYGFFPFREAPAHNRRIVHASGELFVTPWDWSHGDNAGYYRVVLHIFRVGDAPPYSYPPIL
jgi:hypothetical protein